MDLVLAVAVFIFVGVVLFISRQDTTVGRVGRVLIGLGLMLLACGSSPIRPWSSDSRPPCAPCWKRCTSDLLLELFTGAVLAVLSYSSLATCC
jgi:phosphate:Na+ symporter